MERKRLNKSLRDAVVGNDLKKVKDFLAKDANFNESDRDGNTPLHSAVKGGHPKIVQLLLNIKNLDPNEVNKCGHTPLHSAVIYGLFDIVQLLLERTDVDSLKENWYGDTPLHSAAESGHLNIIQLLLEKTETDPNKKNQVQNVVLNRIVEFKSPYRIKQKPTESQIQVAYLNSATNLGGG
ncbi:putative ankyrin repeat protein RBE_0317 [Mytilus edulis]|uniref:putative ankyrin repeat protein RBE_0317 n=1 Tax=Mytilus edulis TaxID=6550 RepID=UPI0039F11EEA